MLALPTGTVTFLFTDIEGSTRLWEQYLRLLGATTTLREAMGTPLPPVTRSRHEGHVAAAQAALDEQTLATLWAEGEAMTLEQAIRCALEEAESG